MSCQIKTPGQCQLRDKKRQYFSIVLLPTDSVIVDHAVLGTTDTTLKDIKTHQFIFVG
jgi:hypothetical protein